MLPDFENSKVNACVDNVYRIWAENADTRATQLVFCDLSTPTTDGSFSVYDDLKKKLMDAGIPEEEIAFIHTADSEAKKKELFSKVRAGQVRVLLGSTAKMGAGTNVQDKLIALHDLDCPWRPSDLQQRLGRIVRQGNENEEVEIYRYVTEGTFDAYLYQLVESKQKFISQIMSFHIRMIKCYNVQFRFYNNIITYFFQTFFKIMSIIHQVSCKLFIAFVYALEGAIGFETEAVLDLRTLLSCYGYYYRLNICKAQILNKLWPI